MSYRFWADALVIFHVCFVAWVILGGLLVLRWPRLAWLHLPAVVWGILVESTGWLCPLTPLENWLRWHGGQSVYHESFVDHYIMPILYPGDQLGHVNFRRLQFALAGLIVVLNVTVYVLTYRRWRRRRRERQNQIQADFAVLPPPPTGENQ